MNRLVHPNGGMPLHGDDFDWLYDGIKEGVKGAIYLFVLKHSGNVVLAGCDISFTAGDAIISEGFVVIDYEVCYCPAQTVAVTSLAQSSLKLDVSYDPSGLDVFADSVSRDTYERRRAIITNGLSGGNEIVLEAPPRVYYEYDLTPHLSGAWTKETAELKAILFNGQIHIKGGVTAGDSNVTAISLPSHLAPNQNHFFACPTINFAEDFVKVKVDLSGNLSINTSGGQQTFSGNAAAYLDGVIYTL